MDRLDQLGQVAWDTFYTQRQQLYGETEGRKTYFTGDSNRHHKFYKAFRDIAKICIDAGYDVADYVITCFTLVSKNHRYITPRDFANNDMAAAYDKYRKTYGDAVYESWMSQSRDLRSTASRLIPSIYASEQAILADNRMPFTAWFRVFHDKVVSPELMKIYGNVAWAELQADKRVRTFLRPLRTDTMMLLEQSFGYFGDVSPEVTNG